MAADPDRLDTLIASWCGTNDCRKCDVCRLVDALAGEREARRGAEHNEGMALSDLHAAMAEIERLREALHRFHADIDTAQRQDNARGDSAVAIKLWAWAEWLGREGQG